jgi:hypothetical protein
LPVVAANSAFRAAAPTSMALPEVDPRDKPEDDGDICASAPVTHRAPLRLPDGDGPARRAFEPRAMNAKTRRLPAGFSSVRKDPIRSNA